VSLSRCLGVFGWGGEEWLGTGRNRSFIRVHHTRLYQEERQSFLGWGICEEPGTQFLSDSAVLQVTGLD